MFWFTYSNVGIVSGSIWVVSSKGNSSQDGEDEQDNKLKDGKTHDDVLLQVKVRWSGVRHDVRLVLFKCLKKSQKICVLKLAKAKVNQLADQGKQVY